MKELEAFAKQVAKGIKNTIDLAGFSQMLIKIMLEATLNADLVKISGMTKTLSQAQKRAEWLWLQAAPDRRRYF